MKHEEGARARIAAAMMLSLIFCGASPSMAQTTTVAGTTPGQFSVNESGAATYRIPIQVPPGIAGMEPKLELSYNSQGGNGLLGVGWSLGGLSAISRCPRTMAQDNFRGGVNFDMNDRYCMDGQRLILVSGTYGVAGSEYRTELESFSKIVASGMAGNGVASFIVQTKAGLTMEYGNTADSRIEAQGKSSVRVWAINKVTDAKANYMTFAYTEDNANGEYYPARIDYSGNAVASKNPVNSIQFATETRPDVVRGYLGGSLVSFQKRLLNIRTFAGTSLISRYRANYDLSQITLRSRVTSFDVCDGNENCSPAKKFGWYDTAQGITPANSAVQTVNGDWRSYFNAYPGDYNGDGVTDLYLIGSTVSAFCAGPGIASVNNCAITVNGDWKSEFNVYPGDYNGDGVMDLYLIGPSISAFCPGPGIASANNCAMTVNGDWKSQFNVYPGDYNGDGVTDLYLIGNYASVFCPGPGIASVNNCAITVNGDWKSQFNIYPGDYNGDGVTDLYFIGSDVSMFCAGPAISSASSNCVVTANGDWRSQFNVYPGDYNGDGVLDLYLVGSAGSYFCAGPGIASANNCVATVNGDWKSQFNIYPGDYNGDGVTDLYLIGNYASVFCAGPGIASASSNCVVTVNGDWRTPYSVYPGDYNGDGVLDLYLIGTGGSYFAAGGSGRPDLLNSISNGTNVSTTIENRPLTSASVHTKGTGSVYPKIDLQYPQYVVSSVASSNGVGGMVTTQYNYGGLKAEVGTGRGMLGFNWMKSRNLANNIESYVEFNQNWPFTGSVARSETRLAGSGNAGMLKRTTTTYAQGTGSGPGVTFVYPGQSVEESWDLGGAPYPSITSSYIYGQSPQYGDPTQITVRSSEGASKTTVNQYSPANTTGGNWILGRLARAVVTSTSSDALPAPQLATPGPAALALASISPASGPSTGGTSFALTGSGFASGAIVKIGGIAAGACVVASSTTINCTAPANTAGAKDVVLTVGGASAALTGAFTYHPGLIIASNTANFNLAQALGNPTQAITAMVTINPGVTVYAASTGQPAFSTGGLPAGSTVQIVNKGSIIGAGGGGGSGGSSRANGNPGGNGGTALELTVNVSIDNTSGNIFGGGGGGGGGAGSFTYIPNFDTAGGGGAGGGAGFVAGAGGGGGSAVNGGPRGGYGGNGLAGSSSGGAGGTGFDLNRAYAQGAGWGGNGGNGGAYGASGSAGGAGYTYDGSYNVVSVGGSPGAGGNAIKLNGRTVTWLGGNNASQLKGPVN